MEEKLDVLNERGEFTGKVREKNVIEKAYGTEQYMDL